MLIKLWKRLVRGEAPTNEQEGFYALLLELWKRLVRGEAPTNEQEFLLGDAVCERLAELVDVHANRFSRRRFRDLFGAFHRRLAEPRPPIAGATYLDLGCGSINPLGMSMLMCLLGARRAIGVDLDMVQDGPRAARGLARLADAMLQDPAQIVADHPITRQQVAENLHGIDLAALRSGDPAGIGSRLQWLQESAAGLSLADASVDVVMSNSFLEHVADVDGVLDEIARVTAPGGFGVHGIDGRDHWIFDDRLRHALGFLREPGPGMAHESNRLRPLEYPARFARHGLRVEQVIPLEVLSLTAQEIAGFAPPWSAMPVEMLQTTVATIVTRKA